jgi:glucose-1-phosphate adenylyltransferase
MDEFTIISYPGTRSDMLLSLTESRSRYMLPIGGRFRVIDFTLRNSFTSGARTTIIYNNLDDDLGEYVNRYGTWENLKFPAVKIITNEYSDIKACYKLILESNTEYYIIYNGDNPSIIDFTGIIKKYKSRRAGAVLFRLNINGKPTMAYTILVSDKKSLLNVIRSAIKQRRNAPNIFEMVINILINTGIARSSYDAYYWPIKNIPEYYELNKKVIWEPDILDLLYNEKIIQSQIKAEGIAYIGRHGKIIKSFVSDFCKINGNVENSILYPGVELGEHSVVKDSIILPFNKIGSGVKIIKTILDERTDLNPELHYLNVENSSKIGSGDELIKNTDFPKSLFSSITLIGKNCRILEGARIGGGCYVASGLGGEFFDTKKFLYDGMSLIK